MTGEPDWYLDACALINLYASGRLPDVASALGVHFHVVPKVYPEEAGHILSPQPDGRLERERIDLAPLIEAGVILEAGAPRGAALDALVRFAARVDDGEAMTMAVALNATPRAGVVTDDAAALRLLGSEAGATFTTSLTLLRRWSEVGAVDVAEVGTALRNVEVRGRYRPGPRHPEYDWWFLKRGSN
ncbi:hypothetical protein [Deinococcus planocerae]|uniref:hypothetical protein n=1 Tax=Deinococcus planocerae TaxID=1737569 RepID=UPI000C7F1DD8|nr:hypothetical protein [Deinococcus planocerae]